MATGIPGPLPTEAYVWRVVPRHNGRSTFFNVESDTDVDVGPNGCRTVFRRIENAQRRADQLNAAAARPSGEECP